MSTLTITKSYAALAILTEAQLDNFRSGLLTLFNTNKFDAANFSGSMALTSAKFANYELTTTDNSFLVFGTDDDGKVGLDSSKNLEFNTTTASCTLTFKAVSKSFVFKTTQVDVPNDVFPAAGGSTYSYLYLLSRYRKPVIEYQGSATISIENNTGTSNESLVVFPKYVIAVSEALTGTPKYRQATLSNTANGYASGHTGAAQGGVRVGLSWSNNTWYAIYAARVRYGTNAGNNFILVADDTLPTQTNESTLDSRYGAGQWVYLGLVRNGYGSTGSASSIIPFKYTNKGWCYFTSNDSGATHSGLTLAQGTTNVDDTPLHTVADGMGTAQIPCDAITMGSFSLSRDYISDWYARDSSDVTIWKGGMRGTYDTSKEHGHLVQLPVYAGIDFCQTRKGTGAVDKRVGLAAFCDRFVNVRRHGHGI